MPDIEIPGPEPDWQPATMLGYYVGKNPAYQVSVWMYLSKFFKVAAGLRTPITPLAERLRLSLEHTWVDPGPVDVAVFQIQRIDFAFSWSEGGSEYTAVWLDKTQEDVGAALGVLADALGVNRDAIVLEEE